MLDTTLSDQIEMLRVQLESSLATPLLVVVSSALAEDGKSLVAAELARAMEGAGYSTLLVLADDRTSRADGAPEPRSLNDVCEFGFGRYLITSPRTGTSAIALPTSKLLHTVSRASVQRFVALCRRIFDVTIVETASMFSDSFSMLAALGADGVVLSIREGRRVYAEDRQVARTFARDGVPFLGVVSVAASLVHQRERWTSPARDANAREKTARAPVAVAAHLRPPRGPTSA